MSNSLKAITASIVLYNTPEWQMRRLLSCLEQSSVRPHVYIVDNSPAAIELGCVPWVTYLKTATNKGYGAGHNVALREVLNLSEYHFVLNPDIYFDRCELEKMIEFMEGDRSIGQLMPKVMYPDGRLQYLCKLLPTPADLFARRFMIGPLKRLANSRNRRFELRFTGYNQVMDVPYLSGCFMLFRTSALREVGLFDERFFMYPEDVDITRRMHARFRTVFFPDAVVFHDHAKASYKNLRALAIHSVNMVRYFNKWGWISDLARSETNRETIRRLLNISRCV